jgi:hypothetical protein
VAAETKILIKEFRVEKWEDDLMILNNCVETKNLLSADRDR